MTLNPYIIYICSVIFLCVDATEMLFLKLSEDEESSENRLCHQTQTQPQFIQADRQISQKTKGLDTLLTLGVLFRSSLVSIGDLPSSTKRDVCARLRLIPNTHIETVFNF